MNAMDHAFIPHIIKLIADGESGKAIGNVSSFLQGKNTISWEKKIEGILICERFNHLKRNESFLNLEQKERLRIKALNDLLNFLNSLTGAEPSEPQGIA